MAELKVTTTWPRKAGPIALILLASLLLRLALAALPGFTFDLECFRAWSLRLADRGPWSFYGNAHFADYPPGYLYVLWGIGGLNKIFHFGGEQFHYILKLPSIFADLASAYLLYRLLAGQRPLFRLGAPLLYLLSPLTLFVGSVWGQVDSILAFFLLLSVYYFSRGQPVGGALAFTVGFLTKPQIVAALPVFAFWVLWQHTPRVWLRCLAASIAGGMLIVLPFFPDNPLGIFDQLRVATKVDPNTTFFTYNLWGMLWTLSDKFPHQLPTDNVSFGGLEYRTWGFLLFAVAILAIILVLRRARSPDTLPLAAALSVLAFFVFWTRMHERYLFPFFLPFLAACVPARSRILWASFAVLTVLGFLNVYSVYAYWNPNSLKVESLYGWIEGRGPIFSFSLLTLLAFPLLLAAGGLLMTLKGEPEPT